MDLIERLLLSTLVLGTMTVLIVTFYKNKDNVNDFNEKKMVNEYQNIMENFTNINEDEDEDEYEPYEQQKEGFQASVIEGLNIGKEIIKGLTKPFKPVIDFFDKVKKFADTLPGRFKSFSNGFKNIGAGLGSLFVGIGKSLEIGIPDIFNVVGAVGKCAVKSYTNFRTCLIWYILDLIGSTLFIIFIDLPLFALKFCTGIDLRPYVDMVLCNLEELDVMVYKRYCFHIIHFPDWVIEKCYSCNYQRHVDKLNRDFNLNKGDDGKFIHPAPEGSIPYYMNKPKKLFAEANNDFRKFLYP